MERLGKTLTKSAEKNKHPHILSEVFFHAFKEQEITKKALICSTLLLIVICFNIFFKEFKIALKP